MANLQGASIVATGTITTSTASTLTLATSCSYVIANNQSGAKCYFKVNDAASPTVSATVYDFVLADQGSLPLSHMDITNISVYVAANAGISITGWPS